MCIYRDIIFSTSCSINELVLLFYGAILDLYQENLIALGGESCSSAGTWQITAVFFCIIVLTILHGAATQKIVDTLNN
jgi:hypothetical protein